MSYLLEHWRSAAAKRHEENQQLRRTINDLEMRLKRIAALTNVEQPILSERDEPHSDIFLDDDQ